MTLLLFDRPPALFIRVRKTGSTSIVRGLFGGHQNAVEKTDGIFRPEWASLYCFAFVRNPFERLVSCFEMFKAYKIANAEEDRQRAALTLPRILDIIEDDSIRFARSGTFMDKLKQHALPMTHPSYHLDKAQFIGRHEHFERDFRVVSDALGFSIDQAPHHNKRAVKLAYREMIDSDLRKRAERVLRDDLERFGYSF